MGDPFTEDPFEGVEDSLIREEFYSPTDLGQESSFSDVEMKEAIALLRTMDEEAGPHPRETGPEDELEGVIEELFALQAAHGRLQRKRKADFKTMLAIQRKLRLDGKEPPSYYSDRRSLDTRVPPHSLDLERTFLGSLLMDHNQVDEFRWVRPDMFYDPAHQAMFAAMITLRDQKRRFNANTFVEEMNRLGLLERVGGFDYIRHLVQIVRDNASMSVGGEEELLPEMIRVIETKSLARDAIRTCMDVSGELYAETERLDGEGIRKISSRFLELIPRRLRHKTDLGNLLELAKAGFHELIDRNGRPLVSTGYRLVDRITHGLPPGDLIVVGGVTKSAKTSFATNLGYNVTQQGLAAQYFALEPDPKRLFQRFAARHGGFNSEKLRMFERLSPKEGERIKRGLESAAQFPFYIEGGNPVIGSIVSRIQQKKYEDGKLALVVVDGMQAFPRLEEFKAKKDLYYDVLQQLKKVAEEENLCVVILTQIEPRFQYKAKKGVYAPDGFADCPGLGELADSAIALHRPYAFLSDDVLGEKDQKKEPDYLYVVPVVLRETSKGGKRTRLKCDLARNRIR